MFKNYLKIALRNLLKHKGYSLINILGLSIGITCTMLIMFWVQDEISYDTFHQNADTIYRIISYQDHHQEKAAGTPAPLGPALQNELPEVGSFTRIASPFPRLVVKAGDKKFYETRFVFADPSLFDIFTFPFKLGDPKSALKNLQNIVISERMSVKYFGKENPIGKSLMLEGLYEVIVSGVFYDCPQNSHIQFDFLSSFQNIIEEKILGVEWGDFNFNTYVMLRGPVAKGQVDQKITQVACAHNCPQVLNKKRKFGLQPMKDVHLDADTEPSGIEVMSELGDQTHVIVFSLLAFLILCIACINFMNLSTARSAKRSKEVGMRKTLGATRFQLIQQFMGESFLMTVIAFILAIMAMGLLFPVFNTVTGKELGFGIGHISSILAVFVLTLLTGFIAGLYPAFYMSAFQPLVIMKQGLLKAAGSSQRAMGPSNHSIFRKGLVVSQFCISITLIIGTLIIYHQLQYIKNRDLGFETDHILLVPIRENFAAQFDRIKTRLLQDSNISAVSAQEWLQIRGPRNTGGLAFDWEENAGKDHNFMISHTRVDYDFIPTMGIRMVEGRNFSKEYTSDGDMAFVLNEEAIKMLGMKSPVGKKFRLHGKVGKIVGVMKNTYFSSLHRKIEPQVYHVLTNIRDSQTYGAMFVKLQGANISQGLSSIKKIWKEENPNSPFEFQFLNEAIDQRYKTDQRTGQLFTYFAALAIFVSCLGLLGLASFMAEQRTREIGIRKVLGATIPGIVSLLSKEFIAWVLIANLISWPVAYYLMNQWLEGFAYRIVISGWPFLISGFLALVITMLIVGYQAIKAARVNPVVSLKYE